MISDSLIEAARFALAKEGGQLIQTVHEVSQGYWSGRWYSGKALSTGSTEFAALGLRPGMLMFRQVSSQPLCFTGNLATGELVYDGLVINRRKIEELSHHYLALNDLQGISEHLTNIQVCKQSMLGRLTLFNVCMHPGYGGLSATKLV